MYCSIQCLHCATAVRKTGSWYSRDLPIPSHCAPCPANTKTTLGIAPGSAQGKDLRAGQRPLREHDMRVGPPQPERAHPGRPGVTRLGPRAQRPLHRKAQVGERDMRIRGLEVEAGGELLVVDGERDLD